MKKLLWIIVLLILIVGITIFIFKGNENKNDSYIAERTGIKDSNISETEKSNEFNDISKENIEEKIAEFSTRLPNDTEARDDNIKLACKKIDGNIVKSGETFSLWDVLGCPTKENGYEKAKTFTADGKVTQSYGGGICQLSTTLYNAVLKVEGLKVIERHEHSRDVPYVKDGKDAAVSYNTADFKFENTLDHDIRIEAKVEDREVKIKIIRI